MDAHTMEDDRPPRVVLVLVAREAVLLTTLPLPTTRPAADTRVYL